MGKNRNQQRLSIKDFHRFMRGPFENHIRKAFKSHHIFCEADLQSFAWRRIKLFLEKHEERKGKFRVLNKPFLRDCGTYRDLVVFRRTTPWAVIELKESRIMRRERCRPGAQEVDRCQGRASSQARISCLCSTIRRQTSTAWAERQERRLLFLRGSDCPGAGDDQSRNKRVDAAVQGLVQVRSEAGLTCAKQVQSSCVGSRTRPRITQGFFCGIRVGAFPSSGTQS